MNGKVGLLEALYGKLLDLAQRVGPIFGFLMGLCYAGGYAYGFFEQPNRSDALQTAFGLGFGFAAAGLGRAQKKASDTYVANEAEKRRMSPDLPGESQIPSIAREIEKQDRGVSTTATGSEPQPQKEKEK